MIEMRCSKPCFVMHMPFGWTCMIIRPPNLNVPSTTVLSPELSSWPHRQGSHLPRDEQTSAAYVPLAYLKAGGG